MATAQDVLTLRRYINDVSINDYETTDLEARIDAEGGDVIAAAGQIWTEKAAAYAELVDMKEGNSSRSLGALHEQAIAMAHQFGNGTPPAPARFSRTRRIERQ